MTDETQKRPGTPEGEGRAKEQRGHDIPAPNSAKDDAVKEALDRATAPVGEDDAE